MKDFAPSAEAKWGVDGLNDIFEDKSIHGVAVVVAAQAQVIFYVTAGQCLLPYSSASNSC